MKRGSGLRVGVIGVGSMGKNYARNLAILPGAKLSGVSDLAADQGQEFAASLDVPFFPDLVSLVEVSDALCIVAPAQAHYPIAVDCLNAGKHILIEKPFTGSTRQASELIELAASKQLHLAASFLERYNPAFTKLLRLLKGEKIHGIDIKRFSPFPERITDMDVVYDMMIHDLDLLAQLTNDPIAETKVEGEKVRSKKLDRVVATFTHQQGIISRISANRVYNDRVRKIAVTTEKLLIEADLLNKKVLVRDFSTPQPSTVPVKDVNQLFEQLRLFVRSIKDHSETPITGRDALRALQLAEEVEKAC